MARFWLGGCWPDCCGGGGAGEGIGLCDGGCCGCCWAGCCDCVCAKAEKATAARAATEKPRNLRRRRLVSRRVVAGAGENSERRKPFGRVKLDLDFSPFSIVFVLARMISDNILVSQLHADFCGDVRQVVQIIDAERAPAGLRRQIIQKGRALVFLDSR